MNLLYISYIEAKLSHGLSWSVPASVEAQSHIDNVLWINTCNGELEHWRNIKAYHNLNEFGALCLKSFPAPFNIPDMVVFEGFYNNINEVFLGKELRRKNIPYIIVPRSALTYQALHNHAKWKKWIAHKLFFNRFIKDSIAIQYLTQQEAYDSNKVFRHKHFIIPNGYHTPISYKQVFNKDSIKAIYVGRIDLHQKGLDVLMDSLSCINDEAIAANFTLDIYGPLNEETRLLEAKIRDLKLHEIVRLKGEVIGKAKEKIILNADLFVLTSRFEGHPMGLIEALAYGVPCLITPGTNMKEEVELYDAGWTCSLNKKDISIAFLDIFSNKQNIIQKGQKARELSLKYNWDRIAHEFHKKIQEILLK